MLPFFGKKFLVDLRIDQTYLRSQPVNSEEGAPMGIGVWCEMVVGEPLDYLYKNNDPLGSLRANISNATVRCPRSFQRERTSSPPDLVGCRKIAGLRSMAGTGQGGSDSRSLTQTLSCATVSTPQHIRRAA